MRPGPGSVHQKQVTPGALVASHPGDCDAGFLKSERRFQRVFGLISVVFQVGQRHFQRPAERWVPEFLPAVRGEEAP